MAMPTRDSTFLNERLKKQQKILPSCMHEQGIIVRKWQQGCDTSSGREVKKTLTPFSYLPSPSPLKLILCSENFSSFSTNSQG